MLVTVSIVILKWQYCSALLSIYAAYCLCKNNSASSIDTTLWSADHLNFKIESKNTLRIVIIKEMWYMVNLTVGGILYLLCLQGEFLVNTGQLGIQVSSSGESLNVSTYIHTYIHTCIHMYVHACVHTYVHTYIHTYIHTYYVNIIIFLHIQYNMLYPSEAIHQRNL